ncbi:DNA-binding LacI/PurR family transcriptional regulator [Phycicoccus badiiscoriae]|uniref:DNA-binding LacI/PurR family transcriptional regulator n=1 Tax=Pedococcus badiiscoriae TaxID=642776 RepID=A0A852WKW7_9MICO|nr:LacI family DNA-binding transcriptional regulator [Pedococcus badiiscoriae]NYG06126.1 DNA-binding LacI/PurR family transcriptional regulator [Pedococcus badiiscoriae]
MARPTINDVARAAGVSKGAVSFALHDRPGVAPATRERILKVAREMGWTPSARARALSVSKALAVGLVMARRPETLRADPFFPSFIAGLETVLSDRGYALLLQVVTDPDKARQSYRRLADEGRVDGVFVTDLLVDDERPALLAEIGLPAVIVGPGIENPYWPVVGADDAPGIVAAVEHLIALGHTRIAHVGGPSDVVHGVSRKQAWCSTLRAAGLPDSPFVETDFSAESGAAATRQLLDLVEPPTAVIYANDLMAMAGLSLAVSRGVDVPGQLSIVGFDDTEIAAHLQPALTSVRQDAIAWGAAAAIRLLELIDGTPPTPIELAPPALVVRASTGPVSTGAAHAAPAQRRRSTRERGRMEKQ